MRLITKGERAVRTALEKCRRLRMMDNVPMVCPPPTPARIRDDIQVIDSVIFSEEPS